MFVVPISVCCCFMGLSSAADAALFLKMVCSTVALAQCLHFVVSMGPSSSALLQCFFLDGGMLDLVFAFCLGLHTITILYSDTASVYGIRTEAASTLGDTIHYGCQCRICMAVLPGMNVHF